MQDRMHLIRPPRIRLGGYQHWMDEWFEVSKLGCGEFPESDSIGYAATIKIEMVLLTYTNLRGENPTNVAVDIPKRKMVKGLFQQPLLYVEKMWI